MLAVANRINEELKEFLVGVPDQIENTNDLYLKAKRLWLLKDHKATVKMIDAFTPEESVAFSQYVTSTFKFQQGCSNLRENKAQLARSLIIERLEYPTTDAEWDEVILNGQKTLEAVDGGHWYGTRCYAPTYSCPVPRSIGGSRVLVFVHHKTRFTFWRLPDFNGRIAPAHRVLTQLEFYLPPEVEAEIEAEIERNETLLDAADCEEEEP